VDCSTIAVFTLALGIGAKIPAHERGYSRGCNEVRLSLMIGNLTKEEFAKILHAYLSPSMLHIENFFGMVRWSQVVENAKVTLNLND
jgi:hypothetical protein